MSAGILRIHATLSSPLTATVEVHLASRTEARAGWHIQDLLRGRNTAYELQPGAQADGTCSR
jgi:hypothetical protein